MLTLTWSSGTNSRTHGRPFRLIGISFFFFFLICHYMTTFSLFLVSVAVDRHTWRSSVVCCCWIWCSLLSDAMENHRSRTFFSQLTSRCGKSQVESRSLFLPHPTATMWLLIPMKCWNIFRQRLPVIRQAQMGYRRRICLKRQKRTLTVRAKLKRSVPPPTLTIIIITPSSQRGGDGRVQQVCLSV